MFYLQQTDMNMVPYTGNALLPSRGYYPPLKHLFQNKGHRDANDADRTIILPFRKISNPNKVILILYRKMASFSNLTTKTTHFIN